MKQRSPFGELVRRHRRHLGLSQEALARSINALVDAGSAGIEGRISPKTIYNHEAEYESPASFAVPRVGTISVYADAFGLAKGSAERQQFIDAAEETRQLRSAATASRESSSPSEERPARTVAPGTTGFVVHGRERSWDALRAALDATLTARGPRVVLLQGEAGIGKTRMLIELGRQAERADDRLTVVWGRCISPSLAPYHSLREAFALLIGHLRGAGATQLVSRSTGNRLRDRAPDAIEAILRDGPAIIGPLISPEMLRTQATTLHLTERRWQRLFERLPAQPAPVDPGTLHTQITAVLRRYAVSGPCLLIVDDLQWASAGTAQVLILLSRLLRDATGLPLLLAGAIRPEAAQPDANGTPPPFAALLADIHRQWPVAVIDLAPALEPAHGRAYIDGRLDLAPNRLDATFREALLAKTAGLPIFVENALWALQTSGQLTPDSSGALTLHGCARDLDLPPSTTAMIGQRFAGLEAKARAALELASVQGEQFFADPIIAIMQLTGSEAVHLFDTVLVKQAHLVSPAGAVVIAGRRLHRYQFAHALYRDHLFQHLGTFQREQHQAATAQALDTLTGATHTEISATIADLYEQAGDQTAAAHHHRLAGVYDLDTRNPDSASGHLARTIELTDPRAQAWEIGQAMLGIIRSLRMTGKSRQAIVECHRAIAFSHVHDVPEIEVFALIWLGLLSYDLGALQDAEEHYLAALPILQALGEVREECRTEGLLAHVLYALGRYEEAMAHADRALALAEGLRDDSLAAESRLSAANCLLDLGCYQEAIATFELAIERFQRARELEGEGMSRADIGLCLVGLERWSDAGHVLRAARVIGRRLAAGRLLGHVELYQGLAHEGRGAWVAATASYARSLRLRRRTGQTGYAIDALAGLLRVNLARGRRWYARRIVWGIGQYLERHGLEGIEEPFRVAETCVAALEALNQPDEARRLLRVSVELLRERAARLSSASYRASYLTRVPHNRVLLRRAGEAQAPAREAAPRSDIST